MENLDQLDRLVHENHTLIKQVVMFVVSATLIFVVCSLIYTVATYENRLEEQFELLRLREAYIKSNRGGG
ncbi:ORF56 similar to XcGV ORF54 [Cydia pomonella granulovirus]|uniref:ORF56 n=2 Tax=Cydia pomonella granulosis virus TaxID=28289 RepID=A0A097P1E9_GVCP|nr:ORF56 similar to XcGV ORF54 [Cydia pomonella granulovirus]AAK70716.1 ORF56 similar to XcGV ORF54 [Cydia pomonella granulovirus]AIU36702.1 ORF56 [Cydia pomonella granulovirus]AIU36981.1 ORF56 [Cydia pomonella granulovirus]AIU37123.1 ORF56 [Cydia pomonella granulovirus]AIU37264.1 ORF56 [Cydia pomonella granulovirus]